MKAKKLKLKTVRTSLNEAQWMSRMNEFTDGWRTSVIGPVNDVLQKPSMKKFFHKVAVAHIRQLSKTKRFAFLKGGKITFTTGGEGRGTTEVMVKWGKLTYCLRMSMPLME